MEGRLARSFRRPEARRTEARLRATGYDQRRQRQDHQNQHRGQRRSRPDHQVARLPRECLRQAQQPRPEGQGQSRARRAQARPRSTSQRRAYRWRGQAVGRSILGRQDRQARRVGGGSRDRHGAVAPVAEERRRLQMAAHGKRWCVRSRRRQAGGGCAEERQRRGFTGYDRMGSGALARGRPDHQRQTVRRADGLGRNRHGRQAGRWPHLRRHDVQRRLGCLARQEVRRQGESLPRQRRPEHRDRSGNRHASDRGCEGRAHRCAQQFER